MIDCVDQNGDQQIAIEHDVIKTSLRADGSELLHAKQKGSNDSILTSHLGPKLTLSKFQTWETLTLRRSTLKGIAVLVLERENQSR